jgi:hypothetical protein
LPEKEKIETAGDEKERKKEETQKETDKGRKTVTEVRERQWGQVYTVCTLYTFNNLEHSGKHITDKDREEEGDRGREKQTDKLTDGVQREGEREKRER